MKKGISLILVLMLLVSLGACAVEEPKVTTGTIADFELEEILYLFDGVGKLELGAFCQQTELTAENVATVIGAAEFSLPFAEGLALEPTMSSSPFLLAVFRLEEADAEAFAAALEEQADPFKWVCVSAEAVEAVAYGPLVLFYMCSADWAPAIAGCFEEMCNLGYQAREYLEER